MALAHSLGFPLIGTGPELNKARQAYLRGELDEAGLRALGRRLRAEHWQLQRDAGIELLSVGDFAWHDPVLSHSLTLGVIPERLRPHYGQPTLDTLFAMARGLGGEALSQWFDSHEHYQVPEFSADQRFQLSWEQLFEEVDEAHALGHQVKPVLIGPLTYLWLGKAKGDGFDKLELLERLLPLYGEILGRLAAQGVQWVQIDEPILALELPQDWKNAFERAYHLLQHSPLKKLLATYGGGLQANLGLAVGLPVHGLHVDLLRAPEQLPLVLDRLPTYKVLSLGLVDAGTSEPSALDQAREQLRCAAERFAENLWLSSASPLRQVPLVSAGADQAGLTAARQLCAAIASLAAEQVVPASRAA